MMPPLTSAQRSPTARWLLCVLTVGLSYGCDADIIPIRLQNVAVEPAAGTAGAPPVSTFDAGPGAAGMGGDSSVDSGRPPPADAGPSCPEPVITLGSAVTLGREAEDYDFLELGNALSSWQLTSEVVTPDITPDPDGNHWQSASGAAYLEALPDLTVREGQGDDSGFYPTPGDGIVGFRVDFPEPGTYFVWIRAYPTGGGRDNSIHAGLDGMFPSSGRAIQFASNPGGWVWSSNKRDCGPDVFGSPNTAFLEVDSAGQHEVLFSLREDGFEFDQWVLTTDPEYRP